jgi:eukaryotic-like serine/threonine-protein kinase
MLAQSIAHYRIQAKIGAGGMGEVYRATDSRLSRDVALKVLPEAFARDAERMVRFEREAKVLASLNHPNIASIYGFEESNGVRALVMELVEGPTLGDRIKQGPIPLDEALPLAKQIAEALEYAHERGIIHRDLKPSNVKLTPDSQVKVLDFGLAKALEGETAEQELQNSPTLSAAATRAGMLLGTAPYMSPEQARGKRVDRRADIWAFGCVVYEMLTGQCTFTGETTSDALAAVIRAEPGWTSLPTATPRPIRELLRRCLQKDPKQRLQAIGDARLVIEETLSAPPQEAVAVPPVATVAPSIWRRAVPWAAGILLATIVGVAVWGLRPRPEPPPVVQFSFGPSAGDSLVFRQGTTPLAISRDGTEVVFLARHNGTSQLFLRRINQLESLPIKGTDNAYAPFFSPDGQWIAFFADGKLKKVPVLGGVPVTLCDASIGRGGTWAPDDSIIFAPSSISGLMRVSAAGGTPQPFTKLDSSRGERSHRWPQILPGGKAVVYANGPLMDSAIEVATLKTGVVKILPIRGGYPLYVAGGYLVFARPEGLFASSFDLQTLAVIGSSFPVLQVMASQVNGVAALAVSETGSLVYVPAGATIGSLAWLDRKGVLGVIGAPARDYFQRLQLSPDGKRIVVVIQETGLRDVWAYDILRGALTRLTFGEGDNASPILSPDGQRIAFARFKDGTNSILAKPADGSGSEETLLSGQSSVILPTSWSPDGKFLAYWQAGRSGKLETWVLPLEGERKPRPLLANQFDETNAVFSYDGKYLAYNSNESGHYEVYVIPFGQGNGKWQISTGGGSFPVWARNGKELFYSWTGNIMGVDVTTQPVFKASAPRVIVPAKVTGNLSMGFDNFEVSPDGQRFLVHQQSSEAGQTVQINFVLNWSQELQRLTPAAKEP